MHEPAPVEKRTEPVIALEPKPHKTSDHVHEPAILSIIMGQLVEYEGMEEDPTNTPTTEGELKMTSAIFIA